MKKKVLNIQYKDEIIHRIQNLQPNTKGLWGNMTITEMLYHCKKINEEILIGKPSGFKPTLKQTMIKFIGLHFLKQFPKGVKSSAKYFIPDTGNLNFEKGKAELIETINRVAGYQNPIHGNHPFFGPLNTNEWRHFIYKHMDHHLRQFQA